MTAETPETDDRSDSGSMGRRYLTPIVTALVLAITVGSLLAGGGVRDFLPLRISVSPRIENGPAIGAALRELLAIETGRSVRLVDPTRYVRGEFDVFLMLYSEFGELLEKRPYPSVAGNMGMVDDDGQPLTESIVIVSRSEDVGYLGDVVNRADARVRSPGGNERVLAAVERLEAAGIVRLIGPQTR